MTTSLVLGPMMRYVDETSASIWVETRSDSRVTVRAGQQSWAARTFAVHGHHYALVEADGIEPGSVLPYTLEIGGVQVWPEPGTGFPPPVIATLKPGKPLRMAYGSCRTSVPHDESGNRTHGVDSLRAYALAMASGGDLPWPDLVAFLGDQVYADLTSEQMQQFIRARRDISAPPGEELKDYEEYAHLYNLAWSDPANRWLLSTLPSAMIFDDHDIRDDWNASLSWKRSMEATSWWHERIVSGLSSYWVYQHLGNLSPQDRLTDAIWQRIARHRSEAELDLSAELDSFAERADRDPESYRWSFCRDFGDTRLIVVDSRAARNLVPEARALLDDEEMAWLDGRMRGGFRHVLVATSLPFLLPMGLHHVESWNEAVSEGAWGKCAARVGEKLRQAVDLEHWGAFQKSFQEVAVMTAEVADGKRGPSPETVTFLSGDVHFSYVAEVKRSSGSRIMQAVCSPIRNPLPRLMRYFGAAMAYGLAAPIGGLVARSARVPDPPFRWTRVEGPWFNNNLASLEIVPEGLKLWWQTGVVEDGDELHPRLETVASFTVASRRESRSRFSGRGFDRLNRRRAARS
ncbi:alkaline phosphatase family protein [Pseudarthrobacter sp. MDT3-26]|uniref:alkaline phosphatase D family protein n=1 Tax=Pseudarthrobacter raffinosi TaxID=2953651 RepID=UPI00208F8858|nr:alkaline phosphatase D family protein [Pseudarthrobacter sp. MDT3-26]MCO4264813.1 alkaline phosphatase family protein [Pseudarthrobacter sp. MDT3-26]